MPDEPRLESADAGFTSTLEPARAQSGSSSERLAVPLDLRNAVRFKGWRGGLLVTFPSDVDWEGSLDGLFERMAQAREFWEGAPCTLDLGARQVAPDVLTALLDKLAADFDLAVVGVISSDEPTRQVALRRGIEAHAEVPVPSSKGIATAEVPVARYLKGTVRSGMVVDAPGHLVILGDVNAGAEVRAGGDIVVFGTLRGVAHAGTAGDLEARIQALNLRPTQLRIGDLIARAPDGGQPPLSKFPEKAIVEEGEIHVIPA